MAPLVEAKRRLAWEARLARSSLRREAAEGGRTALWVFDNLRGPDGYALREMVLRLARVEGLTLHSFGPRSEVVWDSPAAALRALSRRARDTFGHRVAQRVRHAAAECGASVYVVGSRKGTFARELPDEGELWEVQHGLLDPSYFPLEADRFFTRSSTSKALLERQSGETSLTELSDDLSPPPVAPGSLAKARTVVCYSKNPGGGCTSGELARFERAAQGLARRLGLPFQLKPHPRDSRLKLIARHRSWRIARYLGAGDADGPRLVLSSFSTALTSESRPGDLLLNVALSPPNPIIAAEYGWLPTVRVEELAEAADLPVVERQ